jgi:hypothetical protein
MHSDYQNQITKKKMLFTLFSVITPMGQVSQDYDFLD